MTKTRGPNPHHLFPKKPAPKSASSESGASWWLGLDQEAFYAAARAQQGRIAESTNGDWVGKKPTTVTPQEDAA